MTDKNLNDCLQALLKIRKGVWKAKVLNTWLPECNSCFGAYKTKKEAERFAEAEAKTHNDSASESYGVYEFDLDNETILNLIDSLPCVQEALVLERLEN
jgi:hypothetical protein